jgi:CMP-N,N'-diacetyllegionaminic acid synthase
MNTTNTNVVAIIPARGGSVRLPKKNIRNMCGIPLIGWSIIQAKTAKLINGGVYVVTDSEEIAEVSRKYGAEIIMQPAWMANKKPHGGMAVMYGLGEINKIKHVDIMVSMLCTNPLIKPGDIDKGIRLYNELGVDGIGPLQPMREIVLTKKIGPNTGHTFILSKNYEYLREGGNWGVTNAQKVLVGKVYDENYEWTDPTMDEFVPGDCNYFPVEVWQYSDTDTLEEFEMAEVLMERYIVKGRGPAAYYEYAGMVNPDIEQAIMAHIGNAAQQ